MGFLIEATPLTWQETADHIAHVKQHGILQFINVFNSVKDVKNDQLIFGDELEYHILKIDAQERTVKVSLRGREILETLGSLERNASHPDADARYETCHWVPEYGSWMVEGVPGRPYSGFTMDLARVEQSMRTRRSRLLAALADDEIAPTVVSFPLLGVGDFTWPAMEAGGGVAQSLFIPDGCINPHPRFGALTANIRERRGGKVQIRVPMFKDTHTVGAAAMEDDQEKRRHLARTTTLTYHAHERAPVSVEEADKDGDIYMDAMAFGMGCCCLQVTFQARDVHESRHLYDQLAVMAPIMLALTAATPVFKGYLADVDVRWNTIAASVDCRNATEAKDPSSSSQLRGDDPNHDAHVRNSRYGSIDCYICNHLSGNNPDRRTSAYNDVPVKIDDPSYRTLMDAGLDAVLAQHVAHLFVRDPLVVMKERVDLDDSRDVDHWENLQSTNWNTVRWKPPPSILMRQPNTEGASSSSSPSKVVPAEKPDGHSAPDAPEIQTPIGPTASKPSQIGWRTEFRSMEIQLTDFENAAYTVFIVVASRTVLLFELNLYIPISKLDTNMHVAHQRDAAHKATFEWRRHLAPFGDYDCQAQGGPSCCNIHSDDSSTEPMTVLEILTGKGSYYPGLVPLMRAYMDYIEMDIECKALVNRYVDVIVARASGELMTPAQWMRHFIQSHPDYNQDSVVSQSIAYDLMVACKEIGEGIRPCPELLGSNVVRKIVKEDAFARYMHRQAPKNPSDVINLVKRYQDRARILQRGREIVKLLEEKHSALNVLQDEIDVLNAELVQLSLKSRSASFSESFPKFPED